MKRLPRISLCLLLLAAAGCRGGGMTDDATVAAMASTEPIKAVPDQDRYKVRADTADFFKVSPLQATGADQQLKKNARLTMVSRGRGFSQVKTTDNQIGYVGTEDITALSAAEIAQEDAATLQAAQAAAGAQAAGPSPLAVAGGADAYTPSRGGMAKRPQNTAPAVSIPSDAGRNERLPEPDARPTATPAVNSR